MAPRLGGTFAIGALGPVHYAGQLILAHRAEEGLKELTPENLRGGFVRGVLQSAQRVGVSPADIEVLLPMPAVHALLARLAVSQPSTMEAWRLHAGGLGGLLTGVADLTVDGRAPDTAMCITRLARKVQRDRSLAEPLQRLADDLADYQGALDRCVEILNDTTSLHKAYARRRMRRFAAIAGAASLGLVVAVSLGLFLAARARITAVIEEPDPCASMSLTDADLDRVNDALRARALGNRERCEAGRAAERKRAEEAHLREQREREEKKAREILDAGCDTLTAHLAAGQLDDADLVFAGESAPLVARISSGLLEPSDLGPSDPKLPCGGTRAEAKLRAAYARAVLAKPWLIPRAEALGPAARAAITAGAATLPEKLKRMTGTRAGDAAKKAITSGKPEHVAQALALCDTARAMGTAPVGPCEGVKAIAR